MYPIKTRASRNKALDTRRSNGSNANTIENAPDTVLIRKQTVELPFGTLKMWMGATHFLTKQLKNVSTEMSLYLLAYNLKRMMTIVGSESLLKAIRA
jgi:hypothetical protein